MGGSGFFCRWRYMRRGALGGSSMDGAWLVAKRVSYVGW
jgi:hypothetical protein